MTTDSINQRIADFQRRFGEAHLYFAYHAAFPFALTPDLAYRIWTNFQRDKDGQMLRSRRGRVVQIPWIAVADLLLSNFCTEVAYELYEMEAPIRTELLSRLRQDERFGPPRLMQLAKFIEAYVEQHLRGADESFRQFAHAQKWMVSAYTKPNHLAAELAAQLAEKVRHEDKPGIVRLHALLESVAEPLQAVGLEPLLVYAHHIAQFARGNTEEARAYAQSFVQKNQVLQVGGVRLPIPKKLLQQVVLIVDDEAQDRSRMASLLRKLGYETCEAESNALAEAFLFSEKRSFAAVTTDALHYGFGYEGLELIQKINQNRPDLPVVLISYDSPESLRPLASDLVVRGILDKDLSDEELSAALEKILKHGASFPNPWAEIQESEDEELEPSVETDSNVKRQMPRDKKVPDEKQFTPIIFPSSASEMRGMNLKRIQPAVVIGLGGTGVKTITYLKKILQEQADGCKQFVCFLAIDIDELRGDVPSGRLFGEPIRLDPEKNEFFRVTDQTRGESARNIPAVSSWFPDEGYKYLPLTEGARQAKPIGRLGFFLAHDDIARRLNKLTDKLVTPEVLAQFPSIRSGELNIYVVSSICGGTGAGLFLDIAYELRYLQQQAQLPEKSRIKGLFALGDVYDAVSKRVQANTYASLRELNWVQQEGANFHPVYPDGTRDVITSRAFDALYIFGDSNKSDIEMSSPDDFAQLCAEFIFLDSGSDVQEDGDPLSAMMQSHRNNAEVYAMNYDAGGTPRCYSAMGLCKVRFPVDRVAELCAARMSQAIIDFHIIGKLDQAEILEARKKMKEFIADEGLGCDDDSSDLPDRLIEKVLEDGDRIPLDNWVTKSLASAYNNDIENIKDLEIGRLTQIVNFLNKELNQFQHDMADRVVEELLRFQRILNKTTQDMFAENLGVSFVGKFLEELLHSMKASEEYAQQQLQGGFVGHEKRLSDLMNNQIREMGTLLEKSFISFLRKNAQLSQLKDSYKGIREYFINRITIMKMQAAADFYNGVYDAKQKLLDGGEGAISRLSNMRQTISLLQTFIANLSKTFATAYEENKHIKESPFEILIYDNERFSTLREIYDSVYSDAERARLFQDVLQQIGGSIWNLREYMDDNAARLRDLFMNACALVFQDQINQKTVAQRIMDARKNLENPIDYHPRIQAAYGMAEYFCLLDEAASRFADLRTSEQSIVCVMGPMNPEDTAWNEVEQTLRQSIGKGGSQLPFTKSSDPHSILIYREFCGFPAYTLKRIKDYHRSYVDEARRENTPPLQMLTKEPLEPINVPTTQVLSKREVMVVEAVALGVIISDEENYYMVTANEFKRRKEAEAKQRRGEGASVEDRTAGKDRRLGTKFTEVIGAMKHTLPEEARLNSDEVRWMDAVQAQIEQRKEVLKEKNQRDLLCDLYEALYFEGYAGTMHERINLENEIRPAIVFILKRDFSLKEEHIFRPKDEATKQDVTHAQLLDKVYVGSEQAPPLIS